MADAIDVLQIKIDKARSRLPKETLRAIDSVPWKLSILEMKQSKGYSIEQLGELETETELLLCGLLSTADYPKELERRLKIPKAQVDVLVNELNELVFKKIRAELVKNMPTATGESAPAPEPKPVQNTTPVTPVPAPAQMKTADTQILNQAGIKVVDPSVETKVEATQKVAPKEAPSLTNQKLLNNFQIKPVKTEHSLDNISKSSPVPKADPYREIPE